MNAIFGFIGYVWTLICENFVTTLLFTLLSLFAIIDISDHGFKAVIKHIRLRLKSNEKHYREKALFFLYAFFLARITILERDYFYDPLCRVFDKGWIITQNELGEWDFDAINNLLLLLPYIFFMFRAFPKIISNKSLKKVLISSFVISLCTSLFIENCQLIFSIGTFQFADITYNTISGILGGILCFGLAKHQKSA